jgi:hypothetical protein
LYAVESDVKVEIGVVPCCIQMNTAEEYFLTGNCEVTPVKTVDPLHRVSLVDGVTTDVID